MKGSKMLFKKSTQPTVNVLDVVQGALIEAACEPYADKLSNSELLELVAKKLMELTNE
jgi:hypothetical protein